MRTDRQARMGKMKRGAILGYVISMIVMTLGIVVLPMAATAAVAPLGNNPVGVADTVSSPAPGILHVAGWAFDPNNAAGNVGIHLYVNGVGVARSTGIYRPDVQAAYPQFHVTNPGFDFAITTIPAGVDHVTLYAINTGLGVNTVLWDGMVFVPDPNPVGNMDSVSSPEAGILRVQGWAYDPNDPTANMGIHVYINGVGIPYTTDVYRPDVQAAHGEAGYTSGFDITRIAPAGNDRVTVYAINVGPGANAVLWDGYINVITPNPIGYLDGVTVAGPGQIRVSGWAFDPSSPTDAIDVHVYVDSVGHVLHVGDYRPDVQAAWSQTTVWQGFSAVLDASPGLHQVCAYGINVGLGENALLPVCIPVPVS